jgi:hypothetical protein
MTTTTPTPWIARLLLFDPETVSERLARAEEVGLVDRAPNLWQLSLGIARMWHRVLFRSETIGTCTDHPVRSTWRARVMKPRPLRFPFLLAERAVAPWDFSGLLSSTDRVVSHLLGAHHDGIQFAYDLQLLRCHPGALERVQREARAVVEGTSPRSAWLRDLVVFEHYHENLLKAVEQELNDDQLPEAALEDPDITLSGYLRWCAGQPSSPAATLEGWRAGTFTLSSRPEARA